MNHASDQDWLLFMAQLPAEPSSARVAVWRRLKSAGATSLLTGAWILPASDEHAAIFTELADTARRLGGSAAMLVGRHFDDRTCEEIVGRFQADRAREYGEFATRSDELLAEIAKESAAGKFSFAELEEIEDDLARLTEWLRKIESRDFFPGESLTRAAETLAGCREALRLFADRTYREEGATPSND